MDAHIIFITLTAAVCHAVWNAAVKVSDDKVLTLVGIQLASFIIAAAALPFLGVVNAESLPYLAGSVILHFGYYLSLTHAYRYGDFAQTYPVARGGAPILVTLWSVFILHEHLRGIEWLAMIAVVGGIMIFATHRIGAVLHHRKAVGGALLTAVFIAAYTLVDGLGGRHSGNIAAYIMWMALLDTFPLTLYALRTRSLSAVVATAKNWRVNFGGAVLALGAYWMVIWAMSQASIALVSALRETSIIIAALIGAYYFKEAAGGRRIAASVVIFAGIVLLGLA